MTIEITAAQAEQMTGRCGHHDRELRAVSFSDGMSAPLRGWECQGLREDPKIKSLEEEYARLPRREGILQEVQEQIALCSRSWVFSVPGPQTGRDEAVVTVTARGLADPAAAAQTVAMLLKRSLYLVDGKPGEFSAVIEAPAQGIRIEVPE